MSRHLFVCLPAGRRLPPPRHGRPSALGRRLAARWRCEPRKKAEIEDRYLFSVCLSRPTERLWLSWRSADDEGGATARSPFVDEVRELLAPPLPADPEERDEALSAEAVGGASADSVFAPGSRAQRESELAAQPTAGGRHAERREHVRDAAPRAAEAGGGAGADGRDRAVRPLDPGGVRASAPTAGSSTTS